MLCTPKLSTTEVITRELQPDPFDFLQGTTYLIAVGIQPVSNRCITELCFSSITDAAPATIPKEPPDYNLEKPKATNRIKEVCIIHDRLLHFYTHKVLKCTFLHIITSKIL